jgi:hypothetical protein
MTPHLCLFLTICLPGASPCGVEHYDPKPGDILLFRSGGLLKSTLYALGGSAGVTHAAIVVAGPDGCLALLDAPGPVYPVMLSDVASRLQQYPGKVWVRSLRRPLTDEQSRRLTSFACAQVGKPFYLGGFLLPPFGRPVRRWGAKCLTEKDVNAPRWFCSQLVVVAGAVAGLLDAGNVRPRCTDPQDLSTDRLLDLSGCWEKPAPWHRCGPRAPVWWSRSCDGKVECWR